MKLHYIDTENVGTALLDTLQFSIFDRAFVFSHKTPATDDSHPAVTWLDGYPVGANQADFFIVAHLARTLAFASRTELGQLVCVLHSRDRELCRAFEFQCQRAGVVAELPLLATSVDSSAVQNIAVPKAQPAKTAQAKTPQPKNPQKPQPAKTAKAKHRQESAEVQHRILQLLGQPKTFVEIQKALNVAQGTAQTSLNELIKAGMVQRQKGSKKHWERSPHQARTSTLQ